MGDVPNVYTFAEVSEHADHKECWLIISGKVYNVTRFLDEHPGGDEILLAATGIDATDKFEEVGHSTSAKTMMEEYYVGEIDSSTLPHKKTHMPHKQIVDSPGKKSDSFIKMLQYFVPLAILGLAMAYQIHFKAKE